MAKLGYTKLIVCHDADGPDPALNREKVLKRIVEPSGLADSTCVLIPVQELEGGCSPTSRRSPRSSRPGSPRRSRNPSRLSPKEHLERLSEDQNQGAAAFTPSTTNGSPSTSILVAKRLCRSFRPLIDFVALGG